MRIKQEFYTSYKTHSYSKTCREFISKAEHPGIFCPNCNRRLRLNARFRKSKEDRWAKAY